MIPEEIRTKYSSTAKLIYLYVKNHASITERKLADSLGLKLIEIYPVVRRLVNGGYIVKEDSTLAVTT